MASPNTAGTSGAKESSLTTLISRLESRDIAYFYKVMTKSAVTARVRGPLAYALEFPWSFERAHGTKFNELATFQLVNSKQSWPINITVRDEPGLQRQVFAYGVGGWKAFVVHHDIQVGDTLVFYLMGFSHFIVDIIKALPAKDHEEEDRSSFLENIEEASVPSERCKKVPRLW